MMQYKDLGLKVYSPEEVNMLVRGDAHDIDRILLHGVNNLAAFLIAHASNEDQILEPLGTASEIRARVAWVDAQVKRQEKRNAMMQRVAESSLAYAFIAFLGFLAYASWDSIVYTIHAGSPK